MIFKKIVRILTFDPTGHAVDQEHRVRFNHQFGNVLIFSNLKNN